jgi:HEAT repeat protein
MTAEQSLVLTEFARACRTAARSVSLYPATHPSIQSSLARVTAAATRLTPAKDVTLAVLKDTLTIDGRMPGRPDQAITELAGIMHDRLIGELRVERGADGLDWHALLMLLAQSPEELLAAGGITKAWEASGRQHFEIRAIDYAEMLREREGPNAEWDQILRLCLHGDVDGLDQAAIATLLEMLGDSARFGELLERLQTIAEIGEPTVNARVAALLDLVTRMIDASGERMGDQGREDVLQTVAGSTSRLTPEMLIALIERARAAEGRASQVASDVVERIDEPTMASFVARSVERQHGATERLAQALQLLVPDLGGRERVLELARQDAEAGALGQQPGFADLWETAAQMLASYSDESYVSQEYARELSDAPAQALEVERVSEDPPERVAGWLSTVVDSELRALDLTLLLDLLRIETEAAAWQELANVVVTEVEQRTQRGDTQAAQTLAFTLAQDAGADGRPDFKAAAEAAMGRLAEGALARHVAAALRTAPDTDVDAYGRLCRTVGTRIIRPLAEALMAEENSRAIRRLREVLVGFGEAGRETVERLKRSQNPTARRTAIDMLRLFGGEALSDLTVMLDDGDPQVQRDAIRAIAQIGTEDAFAVLQQALLSGKGSSATIPQQIISLREARAVPLLCYVLEHSKPRGPFVALHTQIMEALGALGQHPASIATLKAALHRSEWWAPGRTALLRRAAALALWRIGSPEALRVLEEAAQHGARRIRTAARIPAGTPPRRDRESA